MDTHDPVTKGNARRLKGVRPLAVAAGLTVLAVPAILLPLSRFLDPVRLADWLQPRLTTVLKRDVGIGAAEVKLFPFGFRLSNLEIADPTGLAPLLAQAAAVDLRVRILPLLRRDVVVNRITVDGPEVDLRTGLDGISNFSTPHDTARSDEGRERPFALDLRRIRVFNGRVSFESLRDSLSLHVDQVEASSAVRRSADGPWTFEGVTGAGFSYSDRRGRSFGPAPLELVFDLTAEPDFDGVAVRDGEIRVEGIALTLSGGLSALRGERPSADLAATLDGLPLGRALELAPDSVRSRLGSVAGVVSANLAVRGPFAGGAWPRVTGVLALTDGQFDDARGQRFGDAVDGRVELEEDGSLAPSMVGQWFGAPATLEGRVAFGEERRARLLVRATPDLAILGTVVALPDSSSMAGRLSINARLDIPLDDPDLFTAGGELGLTNGRFTSSRIGVPIGVANGTMRLDGMRLIVEGQVIELGQETLTASFTLGDPAAFFNVDRTPTIEGSLESRRLTLPILSPAPPADTALTYGRVAFAQVGGRPVDGRTAEEAARLLRLARPMTLPFGGRLGIAFDTVVDRRGRSENVRAEVQFGPTFVRITEATFDRYGGQVTSGFNLVIGPATSEPFTMRVRADGVDASSFLGEHTPLGRSIRGTMTVDMESTGGLDSLLLPARASLIGGGRFAMTDGGLRETPLTGRIAAFLNNDQLREPTVRAWSAPFVLRDGSLSMAEAPLTGAPGAPRVGGSIGLDGALDLGVTFDLPRARLDSAVVRRLGGAGAVAAAVLDRPELTKVTLRVRGTLAAPELSALPGVSAATVAETVRQEVTQQAREAVQERRQELEQRATGVLGDLLRRRLPGAPPADTVTARAPTPSATPDTIRLDSARPDTARRDTVRRDTVIRDTIEAR